MYKISTGWSLHVGLLVTNESQNKKKAQWKEAAGQLLMCVSSQESHSTLKINKVEVHILCKGNIWNEST